jgi:hypothetical protein
MVEVTIIWSIPRIVAIKINKIRKYNVVVHRKTDGELNRQPDTTALKISLWKLV